MTERPNDTGVPTCNRGKVGFKVTFYSAYNMNLRENAKGNNVVLWDVTHSSLVD
jgi:hypothetical protein